MEDCKTLWGNIAWKMEKSNKSIGEALRREKNKNFLSLNCPSNDFFLKRFFSISERYPLASCFNLFRIESTKLIFYEVHIHRMKPTLGLWEGFNFNLMGDNENDTEKLSKPRMDILGKLLVNFKCFLSRKYLGLWDGWLDFWIFD